MGMTILGLATGLPPYSVAQTRAAALAEPYCCVTAQHRRLLPALYRRSGVEQRWSVLLERGGDDPQVQSFFGPRADEADFGPTTRDRMKRYSVEAPRLAEDVARRALQAADINANTITHLVTISCTGFEAPGFDISLVKRLGLPPTIARTHIGFMGCHGALNGLRAADAYVRADPKAVVLLCALELCSLHFSYGRDTEQVVAHALFADGAAALVAAAGNDNATHRNGHAWRLAASGSCILPDSEDMITWRIGDHGFNMTLSRRVPELIGQHLRPWLAEWLASQGLTLQEINSWAIHPGGPRIVASVAEALKLSPQAAAVSDQVLAECGNMSSPTVLFILERLRASGAKLPCVALGFGPGVTAEAALFA